MRLIALCQSCGRQYLAKPEQAGRRFHCHCGFILTVPVPSEGKGLESRVVRCSSCGAPREKMQTACSQCDSDFTMHERDMHTLCPSCLTRISDNAKFCHSCGEVIKAELGMGEKTEYACPGCPAPQTLLSREIPTGNVTFFECDLCAGIWMGRETFAQVVDETKKEGRESVLTDVFPIIHNYDKGIDAQNKKSPGKFYRPCPVCSLQMLRRNFGESSGFIIDFCKDHGFWFDENELGGILKWIRSGGLVKAQEKKVAQLDAEAQKEKYKSVPKIQMNKEFFDRGDSFLKSVLQSIFDL